VAVASAWITPFIKEDELVIEPAECDDTELFMELSNALTRLEESTSREGL
jgi:hypothetical protein